jgi:catechol 2,3-dioxygenase-like lactoylglutathione lyase family enzyme
MIEGVLPTALSVSSMEQALGFYCDLLGFRRAVDLPPAAERERWDRYHEEVCGIPGAHINVVYLEAPDGHTHLELIEYEQPKTPPGPRRSFSEPGTAIVALGVKGSVEVVERLREAGVEVVADPVFYETDDGARSYTTYLYDRDGNALALFETVGAG